MRRKPLLILVSIILLPFFFYHYWFKVPIFADNIQFSHLRRSGSASEHVLVLLGTRPEAIKLAPIILELQAREGVFITVVSTGQHSTMLMQTLKSFGLERAVHVSLNVMQPDQTLDQLTARITDACGSLFRELKPDFIIVQGDTTSALVGALVAFYFHIPVGHVEAGLRTWDIGSPFPEEFNRQTISLISTLHFASTNVAALNLANQLRSIAPKSVHKCSVFITGNTVVDALRVFVAPPPTQLYLNVHAALNERCRVNDGAVVCRLVLLTTHRRENHGAPLIRIIKAVSLILQAFPDVLVAYPVHLNPNVRASVCSSVPPAVYSQLDHIPLSCSNMIANTTGSFSFEAPFWSRFFLMEPLDYPDLVRLENESSLIVTDSGGIQEEGAALGKYVLVLRDSTERPEGVLAGVAELVGTDTSTIFNAASARLSTNAQVLRTRNIYGDGFSAERISNLVLWFLRNHSAPPPIAPFSFLNQTSFALTTNTPVSFLTFDLVIIFTVWQRETLESYFRMFERQNLWDERGLSFRVHILVFQNSAHINVTHIVARWDVPNRWGSRDVTISHTISLIPTGYFGRFIAPLLTAVRDDSYWIICDDDVVWGAHYISNMLRVVDNGRLATRNGRFISYGPRINNGTLTMIDSAGTSERAWEANMHVSFEEDVLYDYGGHMWSGRVSWLRTAWTAYPPTDLSTAEDFWLSAALLAALGVRTARPRCPRADVESCACSMKIAHDHRSAEMGKFVGVERGTRPQTEAMHAVSTNYVPLDSRAWDLESVAYVMEKNIWNLSNTVFDGCLYFA